MRLGRVALAVTVALALALVGGACSVSDGEPTTASTLPPISRDVLAIGDSILQGTTLFGGQGEKLRQFGMRLEPVSEQGQTAEWGLEQLAGRAEVPEIVVVLFGTNPDNTVGAFASEVQTLVQALHDRGAQRIVWVPPVGAQDYSEKAQVLRTTLGEVNGTTVIEWDVEAKQHDEWFLVDGVHLTNEGYTELAVRITDAVVQAAEDLDG